MDEPTTIYRERLVTNADLARKDPDYGAWLRDMGIDPSRCTVELTSGKLLVVDPIYLADVYNLNGPRERYLKESGVLLTDFGGDVSGPVFRTRCGGIKVVLLFDRVGDQGRPVFRAEGTAEAGECEINSDNLGCDSGSYIFLDYSDELRSMFRAELASPHLFVVDLPQGRYGVGYEQWETDAANPYESWRRNLVVWPA